MLLCTRIRAHRYGACWLIFQPLINANAHGLTLEALLVLSFFGLAKRFYRLPFLELQ